MKVLENSKGRLAIALPRPPLAYILVAAAAFGLWRVATSPGDFDSEGLRIFVALLFGGLGVVSWLSLAPVTLVLDRAEGMAVISANRPVGSRIRAVPLADVTGAETEKRNGRTRRPVLLTRTGRVPITGGSSTGAWPMETAALVETWLAGKA